jgi:hypothetical protein
MNDWNQFNFFLIRIWHESQDQLILPHFVITTNVWKIEVNKFQQIYKYSAVQKTGFLFSQSIYFIKIIHFIQFTYIKMKTYQVAILNTSPFWCTARADKIN